MLFYELPLDIYTSICSFLDGLDILSLGQTCTVLRSATQERSVWVKAFNKAIVHNHIFSGAYPNYQELDLNKLKDVATGPSRVLAKLRSGAPTNPPGGRDGNPPTLNFTNKRVIYAHPSRTHPGSSSDSDEDEERAVFSRLCLIPGGRFLIASSFPDIHVYDLDIGSKGQNDCEKLLCTFCGDDWLFMPAPSADGKEIRLATADTNYADFGNLVTHIIVSRFIVDGPNRAPDVSRVTTSLQVSQAPEYFTMVHDLFMYTHIPRTDGATRKCVVNVWNYMENTFASWSIPYENYLEFYYDNGYVVMIQMGFLRGWKIPPLRPREKQEQIPIQEIPESFNINFSRSIPEHDHLPQPQCKRVYDWYNSFNPLEVFTLKEKVDDFHIWATYTIQQSSSSVPVASGDSVHPKDKVVVVHPVKSKFRHSGEHADQITSNPFFLCNDSVIRSFVYNRRPFVVTIPPMSSDDTAGDAETETIAELQVLEDIPLRNSLHSRVHFAFDPFSGRLVYISNGQNAIVVLDYIKRPAAVAHDVRTPSNVQPEEQALSLELDHQLSKVLIV